ncbi:hypothetical protein DFQ28_007628 [Apophysomyces sp. BC1034]|nr:hypothetical protein DFQ30_007475 [Apophysomyces sp. BC1015]KAG0176308.1 hypothetical protein DFQ29_006292 [Apophysomyces sp. BC1021]KAG0186558.1 hypothetical protein DFQ28_007628 [Apophysomyces sp. BC1034]
METRQDYPQSERVHTVKDLNLTTTIAMYVAVCLFGLGLCFCLRRANRLIPDRFSFPMMPTSTDRRRQLYDEERDDNDPDARQGLLSEYEQEEEERVEPDNPAQGIEPRRPVVNDQGEPDEEEFGRLQGAGQHSVFDIGDDEDEEEEENSKKRL